MSQACLHVGRGLVIKDNRLSRAVGSSMLATHWIMGAGDSSQWWCSRPCTRASEGWTVALGIVSLCPGDNASLDFRQAVG